MNKALCACLCRLCKCHYWIQEPLLELGFCSLAIDPVKGHAHETLYHPLPEPSTMHDFLYSTQNS